MNFLQNAFFTNLNTVFNTGGYFSCGKNDVWEYKTHCFDQNKFYCITKGECTICINGNIFCAKEGDWFFIPANTPHSYVNNKGGFDKFWIHCDFYPNENIFSLANLPYFVSYKSSNSVLGLFKKIIDLSKSELLSDKITVKATLFELLAEYVRLAHPNGISVKNTDKNIFDEILRYINKNVQNDFSNQQLAKKCFLSTNSFIKQFKKLIGQTPMSYVKKVKIETAKRLLESSDLEISKIAEKIGIYDSSHFCKLFKSYYEKSPKEFRLHYKNHLNG